jgi:hypothetical protein
MAHRTTDPPAKAPNDPPSAPEGDVEVVNAAGERKAASLPKRVLAAARDTLSMTDQLPTWQPGELADGAEPDRAAELEQTRRAALAADADQTLVVGNGDIAVPDQPPSSVLATYRRQHAANTAAAVDESARKVGQLVGLDRRARHYAYDVQHLIGIHALCAKAIDQLADHDLVSHALIREVAAEVAGWQADREVGG